MHGTTQVEKAEDYYVGLRIVNTTAVGYDSNDINKLFIKDYYVDIVDIKEILTEGFYF